jgi:hypothetical protein
MLLLYRTLRFARRRRRRRRRLRRTELALSLLDIFL